MILWRYLGIKVEQIKLPKIDAVNKTKKSSNPIIPNIMPCITFNNELEKIVNEHVAVAWIELHPKDLYAGIKKNPPPLPKPLNIPANKLLLVTKLMFY